MSREVLVTIALALAALGCGEEAGGELAILDVQPRLGSLRGGEQITIQGRNFRSDIGYNVYFGHRKAPRVVIADTNNLLVETPAGDTEGAIEISIRSDDGAAFRIRDGFRYEARAAHGGPAKQPEGNLPY